MSSVHRPLYVPPLGAVETTLAAIWSEVLRSRNIGREDSFMHLGGDSDSAACAAEMIRQTLAVSVSTTTVMRAGSLSELARSIRSRRRENFLPMSAAERSSPTPASFAQQRMLFLSSLRGGTEAYHIPLAYRLLGPLCQRALCRALDRLVVRHEALRTSFDNVLGKWLQRIAAPQSGFSLKYADIGGQSDVEQRLQSIVKEERDSPFELCGGPLVRGRLVRIAPEDHALLLTLHHLNADGASLGILLGELQLLYEAFVRETRDPLVPLAIQYADYSQWQSRWLSHETAAEQADYWSKTLSGVPRLLELPTDRARPAEQSFSGGFVGMELDEELTAALQGLGRSTGTTLFMVVLAGWAVVLSRLSGQESIVIGTPVHNRTRPQTQGVIGLFVNSLALRVDLSGDPTLEVLLHRIRTVVLHAQEHQALPFERVVDIVNPARTLAHTPVFQVMLDWQSYEARQLDLADLQVSRLQIPTSTAKFDLTLILAETGGRIIGGLNYASALFSEATGHRHVGYVRQVLTQMATATARQEVR